MGMTMELSDDAVVGYCDYGDVEDASDVTDTEEGDDEYAFALRAFEWSAVPRGSVKRTFGVFVDGGAGGMVAPEEGRKRGRIDDQLELLRAAIPNLCTNEQETILVGACEYIEKLQRQVQELDDELEAELACSDDEEEDEDEESEGEDDGGDLSSCEDDSSAEGDRAVDSNSGLMEASHGEHRGCLLCPMVEVVRTEEGALKIHIQCVKAPRVLADIMEMLESGGMTMEQVSIGYHEDSQFVLDCVGSEVDGHGIAVDCRHVEACLSSLIAVPCDIASPLAARVRSVWGDHEVS